MILGTLSAALGLNLTGAPVAHGSLEVVPIWAASLLPFVLVFAVLLVRKVVQETARLKTESQTVTERDEYIIAVPGLGTTMADGGDVRSDDDQ